MKWLLGFIFIVAIAAAALMAGGYYGLSRSVVVTRSIEIDRPASIVYPLLYNLRTFNEISPWFDRDPKADYVFTGPREGIGQAASWQSSVRSVGNGDQKIVAAKENQSVDMALNLNGKQAKSAWVFAPGRSESGAKVTWTLTVDCGPSLLATPCRYWNFIDRASLERDLDSGLARLKNVAQGLPALEIASLKPEFVTVMRQDFAYLEPDTTRDDSSIDQALRISFAKVAEFLKANALTPAGPPMAVQIKQDNDKASFRAGIPFSGPNPTTQIDVKTDKTPSGLSLKVIAVGPRDSLKPIYARIEAYMLAHRLEASGGSWEVYLDDPASADPATRRTAIYYPIKPASYSPHEDENEPDLSAAPESAAP